MLAGLDRGLSVAMPRGVFLSSTRATAMEQMDSAMLVHPGHVALVDGFGNLVIAV